MSKTHKIRFRRNTKLTVFAPKGHCMNGGTIKVRKGDEMRVRLKPYVVDGIEVCDLYLGDDTEAVGVPYANFVFV